MIESSGQNESRDSSAAGKGDHVEAMLDRYWAALVGERPGDRQALLEACSGADDDLRSDLRLLDALGDLRRRNTHTDALETQSFVAAHAPLAPGASTCGTLACGTVLDGNVRILGPMKSGGMGEVYLGWHEGFNCQVVVKVLPRDHMRCQDLVRRFQRSANIQEQLDGHKHVVSTIGAGDEAGVEYLVMKYVPGHDLADYVKKRGPLPWREACDYIRQAAEGLDEAHSQGFVHRDIKPSNLLRSHRGTIKLLDWGLARDAMGHETGDDLTETGIGLGTPDYVAPEQVHNAKNADARSDLYSLGCTFYFLLAAKPPFATALDKIEAQKSEAVPSVAKFRNDVPNEVDAIIRRLTQKPPQRRFQSAKELIVALDAVPSDARPARYARRRAMFVAASLAVVFAAAVGTNVWSPKTGSDASRPPIGAGSDRQEPVAATNPPVTGKNDLLRVLSIDVQHFARISESDAEERGLLGEQSFTPKVGDQVTVEAKLSRPAYAYLVAFRPDGEVELCFPDDESKRPPRTDRPRSPSVVDPLPTRYGLAEGAWLWIFAVVASDDPLPPWQDIAELAKANWTPQPAKSGSVWWYDGQWVEPLGPTALAGGLRAKGERALGTSSAVVAAAEWLKSATNTHAVAALGFGVAPGE